MKSVCIVLCLMKCQSETMRVSVRSLAVLRALRVLEATAETAILQIMPWSSCAAVFIKWRQPVAYYLICGSTKGEMLVNFLMKVLDAMQDCGICIMCCRSYRHWVHALRSTSKCEHLLWYSVLKLLHSWYWELMENATCSVHCAHWTVIFWAIEATLVISPILQQKECRSLISPMTIVKIVPRWDNCIMVLWHYVE